MGEERCGKCYCLETDAGDCEIIDFRDIGDLGYAVGMTVQAEGTRDVLCTEMCPCQIKLFRIKIRVLTDDGYRFVEPSPAPSPLPPTEAPPNATMTPLPTGTPTSTPTPTATPFVLLKSPCNSSDFDYSPDLAERLAPIIETDRIRGKIDTLSGRPGEPWLRTSQGTFYLRGVDLGEAAQGRVADFWGQLDDQDKQIFHVQSYEFVPYAVLTGRLRSQKLCHEVCNWWLLFEVEQNGHTYTFGLASNEDTLPELWKLKGRDVTLAGDVYGGRNWLGLYYFEVRYLCE